LPHDFKTGSEFMKKIFWITPEGFLDVDMPVIEQLNSKFDIFWLVIGFDKSAKNMFIKAEIEDFANRIRLEYTIVSTKYRFRNPLILLFYFSVIQKIKRFKSDVLYTSYLGQPFFLHLLKNCIKRNKIVIAIHDVELHSSERKRHIKGIYQNYVKKHYSNFHLFSDSQEKLFAKSFNSKNILLTPLCLKDFGQPNSVFKSKKTRFLFFGNILPYKGLEILIDAVNYLGLKYKDVDFSLTIAGNCRTSEWNEYQKKILIAEIFKTEIRTIKNSEIADLFCNSDYLILPYKDVTQCGPLMIAYNYKIPVIASDLPGFRDYISEGRTGYLFEKNNAQKLAEIMAYCIHNKNQEFFGENIRQIGGEKYSPKVIAEKYSQYFSRLIKKNES
jgi:glycosyltransferase involved in cell wall biosynthesis